MDTVLGDHTSTASHLHRHSHHFVPHHGPEIIHGHEAYKELIVVLVIGHLFLVALLYWLYSSSQKQSTRRRQARSRMQAAKVRQAMTAKLAIV
jgi:hypothetical protein